jgi:predicted RNase H-like nuclease
MRADFAHSGYDLATDRIGARSLIEVYPHPALLVLTGRAMRLPYKYGKIAKYWRDLDQMARRKALLEVWREIVSALDRNIAGVAESLPLPDIEAAAVTMKAFEDSLDAVVCAWVGICTVEGRAEALGDADSAIWTPKEVVGR